MSLRDFVLTFGPILLISGSCSSVVRAQEAVIQPLGQFDPPGVWSVRIELSKAEFAALEPAPPQGLAFGGPSAPVRPATRGPNRESVANLFGMQFPWVEGVLFLESSDETQGLKCRVRYDGDFTYMMAATSAKRPMFVELLDGKTIQGAAAFRLHTMQFDPTMIRERIAAHVFAAMRVAAPRMIHAELTVKVDDEEPRLLGLYTVLEATDAGFLKRNEIPAPALVVQINGLSTIQNIGDAMTGAATQLRMNRKPGAPELDRLSAFGKLIREAEDDEFNSKIEDFIYSDALLRYVAANAMTSNLTGFSGIGVNDFLCLDSGGRFHLVAGEFEVALGGSILSGTPDQLADLSLIHPYAGECRLVERMMKSPRHKEQYLRIVREAVAEHFNVRNMAAVIETLETVSAEARIRETEAVEERARRIPAGPGGFGPGPARGFGPGGPAIPAPMNSLAFIEKRNHSIARQLEGNEAGYLPAPPNFGGGGGGFGPLGRSGTQAQSPITEGQFSESVQVPVDFTATLFARAPAVNYPVTISAEPTEAIYVASDEQGSLGTDRNGGKVLRCVDQDGDGVMDSVTTFCRVDHVRGVLYRDGAVWVCHPPFLSVFHDDDDDGVADRREQLVSGLTTELVNTRGGDHTTNGIRMGIDGWLYIGDGDYGVAEARGVDGSTVTLRGGGILRVRPDGTELELYCSGLRNPFDIAIDPYLNMFTRDNTNDGGGWDTRVSQLFQTAEYGYPRLFANFSDEIMPALGTFGSGGGTGSLYIDDDAWPDRFNQSLLTSDWGRSGVFHHPLTPKEATFVLRQESFADVPRATGMDIDAVGNLYVASWWSGEASVYVGPHVGFVTRVSPKGAERREFPSLIDAGLSELLDLLRAKQAVVRFHAQGELIKRGHEAATLVELSRAVVDRQFPLSGRVAALFAIRQIEGARSNALLISLTSDATIREFAIRVLADRKTQLDGLKAEMLTPFLSDESPRVVAQTLIALGRLQDPSVASLIIPLAEQVGTERPDPSQPDSSQVIPHLALRTLVELDAAEACLEAITGDYWKSALRALRQMHSSKTVDGLIARLSTELNTDKRNEILMTLIRLSQQEAPYDGSWWGIRPDTTGPFFDPVTWEKSEQIRTVLTTAIRESEPETAAWLRSELTRHQVELPGLANEPATLVATESTAIEIDPVDPSNPHQIGNLSFDEAIARTLAVKGNAESGAQIFTNRSCNACHTSAAGQKPIGPHLADIGKRYKSNELIESILKPSEKIAQGFETQLIVMNSGKTMIGFVISENGRQISLRDSQGKTHIIPRDEIDERSRQKISAMPEGLAGSLEPEKLADLIAYLQSL